nr:homeobox protein DBX1-A-like [Parasteatoda tepidariorum]
MYPNLLAQTSVYSPLLRCPMPAGGLMSSPLSPASSPPVSSSFLVDNILRDRAAVAAAVASGSPFLARPIAVSACPEQVGGCTACTTCSGCSPTGANKTVSGRCQNGGSPGASPGTPYLKFGVSAILAAESKEKLTAKNVISVSGKYFLMTHRNFSKKSLV